MDSVEKRDVAAYLLHTLQTEKNRVLPNSSLEWGISVLQFTQLLHSHTLSGESQRAIMLTSEVVQKTMAPV